MRLASIVPSGWINRLQGDEDKYHLILVPRVLNDSTYREAYRARAEKSHFIILDNGAYEAHAYGEPYNPDVDSIIQAVNALGLLPAEIVLPDVPGRAVETLYATTQAAYQLRELWPYSLFMGVPHASEITQYLECAELMVALPGLNCVGVPFIAAEALGISRDELTLRLYNEVLIPRAEKFGHRVEIHLLGMTQPLDIDPAVRNIVRGVDTSKHVRMGMDLKVLDPEVPIIETDGPRPDGFMSLTETDLTSEMEEAIGENIALLSASLNYVPVAEENL